MRPLELLLVGYILASAVLGILHLQRRFPRWLVRALWVGAAALLTAQILGEGWRWQMLPAYVSLIALIPLFVIGGSRLRIFLITCLFSGGLASAIGGYMIPVFTLPAPSGPYAVGTYVRYLTDKGRHERHASSPDASREMMIQVWYPAEHAPGVRAWYRDPRMNTFKSSHFRLVKTHSYWNLPVAKDPAVFSVLLFSPSSGGFRNQNTFEVEELASRGYIVVGIDHAYNTSRLVFPDGHIAHSVPWMDTSTEKLFEETSHQVDLMVEDHVADARFVLDQMESWNRPGSGERLSGRMELTKVGVFGHSFGGALAASLCAADPRIAAGINMDGWTFGHAVKDGIRKPFFFMSSGDGSSPDESQIEKRPLGWRIEGERDLAEWQETQSSLRRFGGYHLTILGSEHGNYSDLVLFRQVPRLIGPQRLDPYRAFDIINSYTLAFFDRYVRNLPAPLLDETGVYPEVRYEVYPPAASAAR